MCYFIDINLKEKHIIYVLLCTIILLTVITLSSYNKQYDL